MSKTILKPAAPKPARASTQEPFRRLGITAPTGPVAAGVQPRTGQPTFTYLGYGDLHWRGQTCHLVGAASSDERIVVFSCGCQASVPWWTLEPIAIR